MRFEITRLPKAALAAALVALALTAGSAGGVLAQVETQAAPVGSWYVTGIAPGSRLNLRAGPATVFPAIGTLRLGQEVENTGCEQGVGQRWCRVRTLGSPRLTGWVGERYLTQSGGPPPGGGDTSPGASFLRVAGLKPGDRLNIRSAPSGSSRVLATAREGEILRNLGCQRADGRTWCKVRSTEGFDVTGWANARYLRDSGAPPGGGGGGGAGAAGPDFYVVRGLAAGDRLNIRAEPSASAQILGSLAERERVQNLGCRSSGQTRWCRIRTTGGVQVTGWVNGRYLREG